MSYGADVYVAIYLSGFPMWLLLSIDDLSSGPGGGFEITFERAIKVNRTALIGDFTIGTVAPLEVVCRQDPAELATIDPNGKVNFTIGSFDFFAGGKPVTSQDARNIVHFLMLHGNWEQTEHTRVENSELLEIRWRADPVESSGQGFEISDLFRACTQAFSS